MILRSRVVLFGLFLLLVLFLSFVPQLRERFQDVLPPPETPVGTPNNDLYAEKSDYAPSGVSQTGECIEQAEWLTELADSPDIKFPIKYARRDIIVREQPGLERSSLLKLDEKLFPAFQKIVSPEKSDLDPKSCLPPLHLDVPPFERELDASHVLFGAATTVQRAEASIPFLMRWLSSTGARLILDVKGNDDKPANTKDMASLERRMRELGLAVTLISAVEKKGDNVQRYFSLVKTLYKYKDEKTKWVGFIDDDTFFTSMSGLLSRLHTFEHQKEQYLGAVSEEWWTVCQYGWIAMGGGGIFLSIPLLELLDRNYADCKKKATRTFGDHRIAECIERHTDTRLTHLDGLHQIDLHGDRSGVFESGRQTLSLHHWKEGYWSEDGSGPDAIRHPRWFPLDTMSLVSNVCGDTCFLQRWQFGKDTLLTNGYSIAMYPKGHLKSLELFKMEKTWVTPINVEDSLNNGYDHYLGPLRPALKLEKEKIHYRFMDAKLTKEGGVRQYFRHLGKDGEINELIELHWTKEDAQTSANVSIPQN